MDTQRWKSWEANWKSMLPWTFLAFVCLKLVLKQRSSKFKGNLPPGPFSDPIIGNLPALLGGAPYRLFAELSWRKNWPIIRVNLGGKTTFIVSSPEYANEVLKRSSLAFGSRNHDIEKFAHRIMAGGVNAVPKGLIGNPLSENFYVTRRVMTKAINQFKRTFGSRLILEEIDNIFQELEKDGRADGVHVHNINEYIEDFLMNHTLRYQYGTRDKNVSKEITRLNALVVLCLKKEQFCIFFPFLRLFWLKKYSDLMTETMKRKYEFIDDLLRDREKRRGKEGESWYFWDTILEAEKSGEIDHDDIYHIIDEALLAGVETTARTIEWGLAQLINKPEIVHKLKQEMDSTLGKGVPLCLDDMERLPFLKATIKEVLRLHPSSPLLVPHVNPEAEKIDNFDIPKNSVIHVNAWMLARDPKYWENPNEFLPERFLELQDVDVWGTDNRLLPFGAGKRMCPGVSVAMPTIQLFIGRMIQRYDLVRPHGVTKLDLTESWSPASAKMSASFLPEKKRVMSSLPCPKRKTICGL